MNLSVSLDLDEEGFYGDERLGEMLREIVTEELKKVVRQEIVAALETKRAMLRKGILQIANKDWARVEKIVRELEAKDGIQ